tara:strand:- start:724 stop:1161 length:438 start_codon:yes stop_codon:yes gene_type:complete
MERVVTCAYCSDESRCFADKQDDYESFMCFNCGFMSDSRFTKDYTEMVEKEKAQPKLINQLKYFDEEREVYWYPSVVNMGRRGIIFPEGDEKKWVWKYAKVVSVPIAEQDKYEGHDARLDMENASSYNKYNFLQACKDMGLTRDI